MSRVSFVLLTAAAVVAVPAVASAADLYGNPPAAAYAAPYAAAPVGNWNGAYAGVNAGAAFGTVRNRVKGAGSRSGDANGAVGGVFAGVNSQVGANFVVGAEADVSLSSQSGTTANGGRATRGESDWNSTVRARVGVAYDRIMPYATAGVSFADQSVARRGRSASETEIGLALGAGVEGQITDRINARLEYLNVNNGSTTAKLGGDRVRTEIGTNIVRAGVGYRF